MLVNVWLLTVSFALLCRSLVCQYSPGFLTFFQKWRIYIQDIIVIIIIIIIIILLSLLSLLSLSLLLIYSCHLIEGEGVCTKFSFFNVEILNNFYTRSDCEMKNSAEASNCCLHVKIDLRPNLLFP